MAAITYEDKEKMKAFLHLKLHLKLGYIEFVMAGVRHSAIVNQAGQLLLTRRVNNS